MYDYSALKEYQAIDIQSKVSSSTPHSLVAMLLEGVLKKLATAGGAIERNDIAKKGELLSSSIRIIDSLRASLDFERGGELADNLGALYDYMERRLLEANLNSDASIVTEVSALLNQIKEGWDAIPNELRGA